MKKSSIVKLSALFFGIATTSCSSDLDNDVVVFPTRSDCIREVGNSLRCHEVIDPDTNTPRYVYVPERGGYYDGVYYSSPAFFITRYRTVPRLRSYTRGYISRGGYVSRGGFGRTGGFRGSSS